MPLRRSSRELTPTQPDREVRLLFAGDIMGHMPQVERARQTDGSFDFSPVFRYVKPLFERADIVLANLETTLAESTPYSGYPRFRTPAHLARAMRDAGIDILFTANNHTLDGGAEGVRSTLQALDREGLQHTGSALLAEQPAHAHLLVERNDIRIAILNYTFSTNGIPTPPGVEVNMLDTTRMARDLRNIPEADIRIVSLHWGVEYATRPNREQRRVASWLLDQGVDIVVGAHPHVVQQAYCNGEHAVIYSLGNFVSNQRMEGCDGGILAEVDIKLNEAGQKSILLNILPVWVRQRDYAVIPSILCDTLSLSGEERMAIKEFEQGLPFTKR